ncbi:MAG: hypothetical protein CFE26_01115 [Verrucomicrobiales bacterium VVV1]|nr:MAG: hypothetical protein CFE26_01115 [Verrucomicrobiales bacterium VVV1]
MSLRNQTTLSSIAFSAGTWLISGWLNLLEARAGGAGGGGHSSGGGGGHSYGGGSSSHHSSGGSSGGSLSPMAFMVLLVAAVVIIVIYYRFTAGGEPVSSQPEADPTLDPESLTEFQNANPDFELPAFEEKVGRAFETIQVAWSNQDISTARAYITDGIYQRYTTQFLMMSLLQQQNLLSGIRVSGITPVSARQDGPYDVIDVRIDASMKDSFVCRLDSDLNEESQATFTEYWSFLRKKGTRSGSFDLFTSTQCPSCGSHLPENMGEICRCAHCLVMVNSGEFDWVLAEITQAADYSAYSAISELKSPDLAEQLETILGECPDLSVQLIEDKASNAAMQIYGALATRNPAAMRRFVTDEVFAQLSATLTSHQIIYNRLYLNEVTLIDVKRTGFKHRLAVGLSVTMQRVDLHAEGTISLVDPGPVCRGRVLILERNAGAVSTPGGLYQHQCPNCGGAVGDTIDVNCQYCGTAMNSTMRERIVTGFLKENDYARSVRSGS